MPAPGVTLTATLQDTSGNTDANPSLRITLCLFGQTLPDIPGAGNLSRIKQRVYSGTGVFSIPLWGNYQINPAGTFYEIAVIDGQNNVVQAGMYQFTGPGSFDLSNLTQIFPGTAPFIPGGGIAVLTNPPGGALQTILGPILLNGSLIVEGTINGGQIYVVPEDAGFPVFDGNLGIGQSLTLTEDVTSSLAQNFLLGLIFPVLIKQDATGGWTFPWPANFIGAAAINLAPHGVTTQLWALAGDGNYYPFNAAMWSSSV